MADPRCCSYAGQSFKIRNYVPGMFTVTDGGDELGCEDCVNYKSSDCEEWDGVLHDPDGDGCLWEIGNNAIAIGGKKIGATHLWRMVEPTDRDGLHDFTSLEDCGAFYEEEETPGFGGDGQPVTRYCREILKDVFKADGFGEESDGAFGGYCAFRLTILCYSCASFTPLKIWEGNNPSDTPVGLYRYMSGYDHSRSTVELVDQISPGVYAE